MCKVLLFFLCTLFQPLVYGTWDLCDIFTKLQKKIYVLYRVYYHQDFELDYNIKLYLEELITSKQFHYENCEAIDVGSLSEDKNYIAFEKLYTDSDYEKRVCLLYKFYIYEFLPKNRNILDCFRGLLNYFITEKQKRDGAKPDIVHLNLLWKEQKKVELILNSLSN